MRSNWGLSVTTCHKLMSAQAIKKMTLFFASLWIYNRFQNRMAISQIPVVFHPVLFKVLPRQPFHGAYFEFYLPKIALLCSALPHQNALVRHLPAIRIFYHVLLPLNSVQHQPKRLPLSDWSATVAQDYLHLLCNVKLPKQDLTAINT